MVTVPSANVSTRKHLKNTPIINFRIVNLDAGQYRRQIEHFEYYWGLQKGDIDLASPMNHIELRSDMIKKLHEGEWTFMPTAATLDKMFKLAEHNSNTAVGSRKNCLIEFPDQEYEYDVVPLGMIEHGRTILYVHDGARATAYRAPYSDFPRIRTRAHPYFVSFMASENLDENAPLVMPIEKAKPLANSVGRIVSCWIKEPPSAFLIGQDVWKPHRHPLSDDGEETCVALQDSSQGNAPLKRLRKTTHAPCAQPKTVVCHKPYARYGKRPLRTRGSALPCSRVVLSGEGSNHYDLADLRGWVDKASREATRRATSWPAGWLTQESRRDAVLAQYRTESVRDAEDALHPQSTYNGGGLVLGDGQDRSRFSSNNWAMRAHDVCLWTLKNPYVGIKHLQ
ncbi:hypothetical protein HDZ31DRAFT_42101 [Schizophyllum fasciatum]